MCTSLDSQAVTRGGAEAQARAERVSALALHIPRPTPHSQPHLPRSKAALKTCSQKIPRATCDQQRSYSLNPSEGWEQKDKC